MAASTRHGRRVRSRFSLSRRGQPLHDALETIDARAFDEHRDAEAQFGPEPAHESIRILEPLGTGAEARNGARRQRTQCKQALDPTLARIAAGVRVAWLTTRRMQLKA